MNCLTKFCRNRCTNKNYPIYLYSKNVKKSPNHRLHCKNPIWRLIQTQAFCIGFFLSHSSELVKQETARQIATALESLTERQRLVVVAKVYDGCTFAQIAEQMGLSVPTIKSHYLRALRTLRTKLAPLKTELGAGHEV